MLTLLKIYPPAVYSKVVTVHKHYFYAIFTFCGVLVVWYVQVPEEKLVLTNSFSKRRVLVFRIDISEYPQH